MVGYLGYCRLNMGLKKHGSLHAQGCLAGSKENVGLGWRASKTHSYLST